MPESKIKKNYKKDLKNFFESESEFFSQPKSFSQIFSDMLSEYQKFSGVDLNLLKTSDVYLKLKTLASQIFSLEAKLDFVKKQAFAQTATGIFLDYHAQTRGLVRKKPAPSEGVLTFSVPAPLQHDVRIPQGTICYSDLNQEYRFSTKQDSLLKQGETQVDVLAVSMTNGLATNAVAGSISSMCNPPEFVQTVVNSRDFEGGLDEESDESLRARLLENFQNISNGCNTAYYKNIVLNYDGVLSANVIPRKRGRGTVDVVVATNKTKSSGKSDSDLLKKIQEDLQTQKEINVDVFVLQAKQKKLKLNLNLELDNTREESQVYQEVKEEVSKFVFDLKVCEPLRLAALGAQIFKIPGIKNYKFLSPTKDVFIDKDEIICLDQIDIKK